MHEPQFVHMYHAGLRASAVKAGKDKRWSMSDLLNEADRTKGASKHIANPVAPKWLLGSRKDVEQAETTWRKSARQNDGKRNIRIDSPSVAAVVVSWPVGRDDDWLNFRNAAIDYYKNYYDARVVGIVEHTDEPHHHIHLFIVPLEGEAFGLVHPGVAARIAARQTEDNRVTSAYIAAMVKWCNEFWENVGKFHGLKRHGPRRKRVSRRQINSFRHERDLLTTQIEEAKLISNELQINYSREREYLQAENNRLRDQALKLLAQLDAIAAHQTFDQPVTSENIEMSADDVDDVVDDVVDDEGYPRQRMSL